jgi:hypothetical protein
MFMDFVQTMIRRQQLMKTVPHKMTIRNWSDSDGGHSIGCRRGDCSKQSGATSRSFEFDSNVTDGSDLH